MANPRDWGDRTPSDSDDVSPVDPTSNFQEQDYDVQRNEPKKKRSEAESDFAPDPGQERRLKEPRHEFMGIILSAQGINAKGFPQYSVGKQDGEVILAYSPSKEFYIPGDNVTIHRDETEAGYTITGRGRLKELPAITLTPSATQQGTTAFKVQYNTEQVKTPIDSARGGDPQAYSNSSGTVTVNNDGAELYEIAYQVGLQILDSVSLNAIYIEVGCQDYPIGGPGVAYSLPEAITPKLWFNLQAGFFLTGSKIAGVSDCVYVLHIGSTVRNAVLNQRSIDNSPIWTDSPRFDGNCAVGLFGTFNGVSGNFPWVKIYNGNGAYAWIGAGNGTIRMRMPTAAPTTAPAYLQAVQKNGNCVQLGWRLAGKTGTIAYKDASGTNQTLTITEGLITGDSGGSLQDPSHPSMTIPTNYPDQYYDPCSVGSGDSALDP